MTPLKQTPSELRRLERNLKKQEKGKAMNEQKLTVAKASQTDVDEMRTFLQELEELLTNEGIDLMKIGAFVEREFPWRCGRHYERILFGYETLVDNACDQSLTHLDWKPEIKKLLERK